MTKNSRAAIALIATMIALTGCASEAGVSRGPVRLDVITPTPTDAEREADFLAQAGELYGLGHVTTAEFKAAGREVCNQFETGIDHELIVIAQGKPDEAAQIRLDNNLLAYWGAYAYCPQFLDRP